MSEERLREIIRLLAQPGYSIDNGGNEINYRIIGPSFPLLSREINYLDDNGWLKGKPNGSGSWLSDEGRKAFMRSTDELGDGSLKIENAG